MATLFAFIGIIFVLFNQLDKVASDTTKGTLANWIIGFKGNSENRKIPKYNHSIGSAILNFFGKYSFYKSAVISVIIYYVIFYLGFDNSYRYNLFTYTLPSLLIVIAVDYISLSITLAYVQILSEELSEVSPLKILFKDFYITLLFAYFSIFFFINQPDLSIYLCLLLVFFWTFFPDFSNSFYNFINNSNLKRGLVLLKFIPLIILILYVPFPKIDDPFVSGEKIWRFVNLLKWKLTGEELSTVTATGEKIIFNHRNERIYTLFITTFFTSVWLWIFYASSLTTRFLLKTKVNIRKNLSLFNLNGLPFTFLGIVAGVTILIIGGVILIILPVIKT